MKIHHVGYAVKNIDTSLNDFKKLGFKEITARILDEQRSVFIQFIKNGDYVVELIEPSNDNSPINNILSKIGNSTYHLCYEIDDIEKSINELKSDKYVIIEVSKEAIAINNKKVAFLYKKNIGIIELVEK